MWSDAESGLSTQLPKVHPVEDRCDQQVPVYLDQTVPEWDRSGSAFRDDGGGVSFDDILCMYQSSVAEKASGSTALREILRHRRSRRRPWLWRSGPRKRSRFGQRVEVGESLLRSLQEAIERTSICDLPASSNQARRCELQRPLTFSSVKLTTSSL